MSGVSEVIMIVDDDPIIRAMCKSSFEENGYSVLEAESGQRAVSILNSQTVDVVFLDILMPDMDGLETLLEIKRAQPLSHVYAMSGGGRKGNYGYLDIARQFGADDVVKKPFSPGALVDLVRARANKNTVKSRSA